MNTLVQAPRGDTERMAAALSSQLRAANSSISEAVSKDDGPGTTPMLTVWSAKCGPLPYADFGKRLYPHIDVVSATFEAARVVAAWELGLKIETVVTGSLWQMRLYDLLGIDGRKTISTTHVHVDGELSDTEYLVLCYAGSVAYARRSHQSVSKILDTFGESNFEDIESICGSWPEWSRDFAQKESLRLARSICTKYELLINQVVAILLKKGRITWKQFQQVVKSAGYAHASDKSHGEVGSG